MNDLQRILKRLQRKFDNPMYWENTTIGENTGRVKVARMRCPHCLEPWQGEQALDDEKRLVNTCIHCNQDLQDVPIIYKIFPPTRRACPWCGSAKIKLEARIVFLDMVSWSERDGDYFEHDSYEFNSNEHSCDTEWTGLCECQMCNQNFQFKSAPLLNAGLAKKPRAQEELLKEARELLGKYFQDLEDLNDGRRPLLVKVGDLMTEIDERKRLREEGDK